MEQHFDKIVIIGASAAGMTAAKEIRQRNSAVDVTVLSDEAHWPYYRPFLTEYLGDPGVINKPNFYLNPADWYARNNINLRLGEKATAINLAAKTVTTAKQRELPYDKLILATGSRPFVPNPEILHKANVFAIRTYDDAQRVEAYARQAKHIVVIGGGLLGLETADALLQHDVKITIIEFVNRILPMQLDEEGSLIFQGIMEKHGIDLKLGTVAETFAGEQKVTAVRLKSGDEIPTDMVVFSIGVRANLDLAAGCGIAANRGVIVNERMETNVPDIYACGDVAEFGRTTALWTVAVEQGKVAGANAASASAAFQTAHFPARLQAFDTKIYSVGDLGRAELENAYLLLGRKSLEDLIYKNLYFKGDKLTGGVLIGDVKKSMALLKALNSMSLAEAMPLLD